MELQKAEELPENPRIKANFISNLLFCYTLPIFFKGRKKDLTPSDLYQALDEHKSSKLGDRMTIAWDKQIQRKISSKTQPSLIRAMLEVFRWDITKQGIVLICIEFGLKVTQPLFVGGLVHYYMQTNADIAEAYLYAAGVIACSALGVLCQHAYMLGQMHCGMKMRISLISLIYRKALRLSQTALGNTTAGQIVNLLSNDVGKFDQVMFGLHQLWVGPLEMLLIVYIMYQQIGATAFAGVGFLVVFIPLQTYVGKKTSTFRAKTAVRSDERIRLMNEIVHGIQVIKMYAWEKPFGKLVTSARNREVNAIRYTSYMRAIMLSFSVFVTRFSIFISLIVYALLGLHITAEKAFVVTAYYGILRQAMTIHFPRAISTIAEILVSFKRIQRFLLYEEAQVKHPVDDQLILNGDTHTSISVTDKDIINGSKFLKNDMIPTKRHDLPKASLRLINVKAKWDSKASDYTLNDVSFTASPGELVAVIGSVGAGKSSLIQAILGELSVESGSIDMNGLLSYASQDPWLFGGTVQQNILFGQPMDKRRYKEVIKQCALKRDLQLLQFGDRTIVGDRGQALSGGQKARINLARAVYRKASIYLLDDPLSAVDTHVGKHLFEHCMRNYLKDHIVILATHQLQFLRQADKIVVIEHGKVVSVGTYTELMDSKLELIESLQENQDDDSEPVEEFDDIRCDTSEGKRSRRSSESSVQSAEEIKSEENQMDFKETQQHGSIGSALYKKYFASGGGFGFISIVAFFCISAQILASSSDYFLSYWVNKETRAAANMNVPTDTSTTTLDGNLTDISSTAQNASQDDGISASMYSKRDMTDVYIFTSLVVATIIVTISRSFLVFDVCLRASRNLHDAMYQGISRATMFFFNTNPAGRILNRFSKDIGQVDELLPTVILEVIQIFLTLFGIMIVIIIINTWFVIPTALIVILFYNLRGFYLKTSRDVKRMEGITRSPIFSHLSSSLMGLSTIRAFGAEKILHHEFDQQQDLHSSTFYAFISTSRAFGFWLDSICVLYIATVTLSFFILGEEQAGNVGLAITQALGMTGMVQWGMRQSAELENTMTSVERIVEYGTLEKEGELNSADTNKPPTSWPESGHIKFQKLSLRYFPDPKSDLVLQNLEFEILPNEKVGIVGRTGAGKSSIINALFRLAHNDGSIYIDGRDIHNLGLHDLRTKVSIIPQEPVLFSGTMRYNLDPFEEYSDAKIWQALEEVKLKSVVSELNYGLQSRVNEGGSNFSVGQRQLVCLARAILRENKILVLDEATANVDPQTDQLIQTTIREKFRDCTVITIAHRLHTIMDSDKVLVMDAGHIVEYGAPYVLLTETGAESKIFYGMAQETGDASFRHLVQVAKEAYDSRQDTGVEEYEKSS